MNKKYVEHHKYSGEGESKKLSDNKATINVVDDSESDG